MAYEEKDQIEQANEMIARGAYLALKVHMERAGSFLDSSQARTYIRLLSGALNRTTNRQRERFYENKVNSI